MKIQLELKVKKTEGPNMEKELVVELLDTALPTEIWLDDTGFDAEWSLILSDGRRSPL